jgi:hypothetical protein
MIRSCGLCSITHRHGQVIEVLRRESRRVGGQGSGYKVIGGRLIWRWNGQSSCCGDDLRFGPLIVKVVEASPEGCDLTLDLPSHQFHSVHLKPGALTCSCLTICLLKSSVPTYVPIVTR